MPKLNAGRHWGLTVHFSADSRLHRFVSACVVALLTANGFAVALLATDNPLSTAESPAQRLMLITTADGHRYLVDPNTEAGRQAIEEAKRNGSTITQVTAPTTSSTDFASRNPGSTFPTVPSNGILPIDPGSELDKTISTLLNTVTTVSSIIENTKKTVEDTKTSLDSIIDDTQSTIDEIINDTQSTIIDVSTSIDSVSSSVAPTIAPIQSTIATVITTVSTLLPPLGSTGESTGTSGTGTDPICVAVLC
jgi:hypothetical protein